jgi:type VI secretion system secreted protein VgrG
LKVTIDIPSYAGHGLTVRAVDIVEGLSMPFEVALVATSPDADLDFERLAGAEATCTVDYGSLGKRAFSGLLAHVELTESEPAGLSTYALRIVPRLWLLSQRRGHRIFQHQTALDVARALLAEWKIELTTKVTEEELATHEVRVQYGETDLDLLDRLLEEAGIAYYFDDQRGDGIAHLVLTDSPERAVARHEGVTHTTEPSPTWELPFVADVRVAHDTRTGVVTLVDYDFRRPDVPRVFRAELSGSGEQRLEQYAYAPGSAVADVAASATTGNDTPVADDESVARTDEHAGYGLAARRLDALRSDRRRVELTTSLVDLAPGAVFTIAGSPRPELAKGQRLLVTQTHIDGRIDHSFSIRVTAAFAGTKVRPPRRVAWPRIDGVQSATVMGPPGERIHVDELGRVRVRFHWDREGVADDHRSAWVRVDDGWAGAGFGIIALPRVGQEVLVAFLEGNPDQPVVVGRVYDTSNPAPRPLPGGATESLWRTQSSPGGAGYHELSFDDSAGRERVMLRSERDLQKYVVAEETEETLGDRASFVAQHLATTITDVDGVTVGQMHAVRMATLDDAKASDGGAPNVTPTDTRREIIAKRITLTTGGATIVLDGPDITVTAQKELRIVAGGTVTIQGEPYVQINPAIVTKRADASKAPPPPDNQVWFRLVSNGQPVAGARVHVTHEGGASSEAVATDGAGRVRVPVDQAGTYAIHIGDPPPPAPAAAPKPAAPKPAPSATPAPKAAAPQPAAPPPAPAKPPVKVGATPSQPTAKAKPTDHEVPLSVEIVSPAAGASFEIDPGTFPGPAPSMPSVKLKAKVLLQGQETSSGTVKWEMTIAGQYRVRDNEAGSGYRMQAFKFAAGTATTKPNEELSVQLKPAEIVGGALEIKATYDGGPNLGNLSAFKVLSGLKVVGKNPPRLDVEKYIVDQAGDHAWLFLRMFCHESDHTLGEFKSAQPRYGPPSGVGVAQQDPEEQEWVWPKDRIGTPSNFFPRIFWDWRKNVVSGIEHFLSDKVPTARRLIAKLRKANPALPAAPEGLVMRAAIRAYNGGRELAASPDGAHYIVAPHTIAANVGYVEWVLGDPHGTLAPQHPVPADVKLQVYPALPKR